MKVLPGLLMSLLLSTLCAAQEGSAADWRQKADSATGGECTRLCMQVARQTLEDANHLFATGEVKTAHDRVDVALQYVRRAVECSLKSRKGEKTAEIDLRKLIRRMKDIQQSLDSEDRPHLSRSLAELEEQRDKLLRGMFGAAAGGATEKKP